MTRVGWTKLARAKLVWPKRVGAKLVGAKLVRVALAAVLAVSSALFAAGFTPERVFASRAPAEDGSLRVLFIGNSYTRFNMLGVLFERMVARDGMGTAIHVEVEAHPGYTLRKHWLRGDVRRLLATRRFTHVVIQAHSLDPIDRPEHFDEYARRLYDAATAAGARVVFYETWARREGSRFYRKRPVIGDAHAMQARIHAAYSDVADATGARLAPVGRAFLAVQDADPALALHHRDGSHPTYEGTYLAASVLYATITGRSPNAISYVPYEIDGEVATWLRARATDVVTMTALASEAEAAEVAEAADDGGPLRRWLGESAEAAHAWTMTAATGAGGR